MQKHTIKTVVAKGQVLSFLHHWNYCNTENTQTEQHMHTVSITISKDNMRQMWNKSVLYIFLSVFWSHYCSFLKKFFMCPGMRSTGLINKVNNNFVPFRSANSRTVLLRMLAPWLHLLWHLSGTEPSLMWWVTPVPFLLWQFKMSAVRKVYCSMLCC